MIAGRGNPRQLLAHEGFCRYASEAGEATLRRYESLPAEQRAEQELAAEQMVQRVFGSELDEICRQVEDLGVPLESRRDHGR